MFSRSSVFVKRRPLAYIADHLIDGNVDEQIFSIFILLRRLQTNIILQNIYIHTQARTHILCTSILMMVKRSEEPWRILLNLDTKLREAGRIKEWCS